MIKSFTLYIVTMLICLISFSIGVESRGHELAGSAPSCTSDHLGVLWSGGEHIWLGNKGYELACSKLGLVGNDCMIDQLVREDAKWTYSYGQAVALGDFYATVSEVYKESGSGPMSDEGLTKVFKCMDDEGHVFSEQKKLPEVTYPDCTWVYINNNGKFLKLVSNNFDHFAWYNVKTYVFYHQRALSLALKAHKKNVLGEIQAAKAFYIRALFYNSFADHFLTDSFAAGHVRIPRTELKRWAKKNLFGFFKGTRGDSLAMVLHNTEGKDSSGLEVGLEVKNARGDRWITHSDDKLHECTPDSHPRIRIPVEAVSLSVLELEMAYRKGALPSGNYAALKLVPFVVGQSLAKKYALRGTAKERDEYLGRLKKALPSSLQILTGKNDIKKMIKNLDKISKALGTEVRWDLVKNVNLVLRIPKEYLNVHMDQWYQ